MKYTHLFLTLLSGILFLQCATRNKVTYSIPENIPEERRNKMIAQFEKGEKLYKMNCAECHGVFTHGKDNIPNFSEKQFDNYSTKFIMQDPKNHAVALKMSMEQMNEVIIFLRYKKQNKRDSAVIK